MYVRNSVQIFGHVYCNAERPVALQPIGVDFVDRELIRVRDVRREPLIG